MIQKINGIDIHYTVKGSGYPLIMLHGNGEDLRIFDALANKLSKAFTVYQIDSRGHGLSEKTTDISYELMREDVLRFIRANKINMPIILGFSDGAIVGLLIAIKHSSKIMGLISCGANLNPNGLKASTRLYYNILYNLTRQDKYKMVIEEPDIDMKDLQRIDVPVMVVAGEYDVVIREHTQYISSCINDSELRILPKENHSSYIIKSTKMNNLVIQFIRSIIIKHKMNKVV